MDDQELEQLTVAACAGDDGAIDRLVEHHLPELRGFVRLRFGPLIRAQESHSDLVQSVCREVLTNRSRFRHPNPSGFKRWLFLTALRKISNRRDHYLALKRDVGRNVAPRPHNSSMTAEGLLDCYGTLSTPSAHLAAKEQTEQLEAAFDELPDEYREVITLAHIVGMSRAEIAEQLGKSEGVVRMILHRAMSAVARKLEVYDPG